MRKHTRVLGIIMKISWNKKISENWIWFDTTHDQFTIILNFSCTNVTILKGVKKLAFLRKFTAIVSVTAF